MSKETYVSAGENYAADYAKVLLNVKSSSDQGLIRPIVYEIIAAAPDSCFAFDPIIRNKLTDVGLVMRVMKTLKLRNIRLKVHTAANVRKCCSNFYGSEKWLVRVDEDGNPYQGTLNHTKPGYHEPKEEVFYAYKKDASGKPVTGTPHLVINSR